MLQLLSTLYVCVRILVPHATVTQKSEGCLLPGESDESDKDAMLKSVGGGVADFIWKQSRRSLRLRRLSSPASVFKGRP